MIARATKVAVRLYQYTLGLVLPDSCRFEPTCSEYAIQAVERHGARGLWLALRRILRCHPWGRFGPDPVPERNRTKLRPQITQITQIEESVESAKSADEKSSGRIDRQEHQEAPKRGPAWTEVRTESSSWRPWRFSGVSEGR